MPKTNNFYIIRIRSNRDSKKQLEQLLEREKTKQDIIDYDVIDTSSKIQEN